MDKTKTCNQCLEEKLKVSFPKKGSVCKVCTAMYKKKYYRENKKAIEEYRKNYYNENREYFLEKSKQNRENNKEKIQEYRKNYWLKNKKSMNKRSQEWRSKNPEKNNALNSKYRASKLNATPAWLTVSQKQEMEIFYWLARDLKTVTGEDYHVDHIVPLKGKNVSGLHVPWNLQVLPSDLNISKGNTHAS